MNINTYMIVVRRWRFHVKNYALYNVQNIRADMKQSTTASEGETKRLSLLTLIVSLFCSCE